MVVFLLWPHNQLIKVHANVWDPVKSYCFKRHYRDFLELLESMVSEFGDTSVSPWMSLMPGIVPVLHASVSVLLSNDVWTLSMPPAPLAALLIPRSYRALRVHQIAALTVRGEFSARRILSYSNTYMWAWRVKQSPRQNMDHAELEMMFQTIFVF